MGRRIGHGRKAGGGCRRSPTTAGRPAWRMESAVFLACGPARGSGRHGRLRVRDRGVRVGWIVARPAQTRRPPCSAPSGSPYRREATNPPASRSRAPRRPRSPCRLPQRLRRSRSRGLTRHRRPRALRLMGAPGTNPVGTSVAATYRARRTTRATAVHPRERRTKIPGRTRVGTRGVTEVPPRALLLSTPGRGSRLLGPLGRRPVAGREAQEVSVTPPGAHSSCAHARSARTGPRVGFPSQKEDRSPHPGSRLHNTFGDVRRALSAQKAAEHA